MRAELFWLYFRLILLGPPIGAVVDEEEAEDMDSGNAFVPDIAAAAAPFLLNLLCA